MEHTDHPDTFAVYQGLVLRTVVDADPRLVIEVADDHGPCGAVTYTFHDDHLRRSHLATLQAWQEDGTRLTYVRRRDGGVLLDDRQLVRLAFEG